MLDLKKIRESRSIAVRPTRKNLSELISESYNLLYDCEDKRLRKMIESHIMDVRENPTELSTLAQNLQTLSLLNESSKHGRPIREDEELDDPRLETDDATIDQLKAVNPQQDEEPEFDAPQADPEQVEKFAENSRGKTFYKALTRATTLNESTKRFNLLESLSIYKAANSAMTQMAIELEHNNKFQETFNVLTKVLGRATRSILESIYRGEPISEHSMETVSRFSKALREDDQEDIDDFIDWVDNEYPEEGESSDDVCPNCGQNPCVCEDEIEIPDDLTPEQAVDVITDIITDIYPDLVVDAVDEEGEQTEEQTAEEVLETVTDEEAEDLKQYLALLRAGDEETHEDAEPTEEEIDALEEHLLRRRKMKETKKSKNEASDPLTTSTEGEEVDSDVPDPDKPDDAPGKDILKETKKRVKRSIKSKR